MRGCGVYAAVAALGTMTRPPAPGAPPAAGAASELGAQDEAAAVERQHVAAQKPPEESKYKTLELRSFQVDEPDARHAPTRKIDRGQVQNLLEQYGITGDLPPNSALARARAAQQAGLQPGSSTHPQGNTPSSPPDSQQPISQRPVSRAPSSLAPAAVNYTWLWVVVLFGAAIVGVLVGLALLKVR